MVFFEFCEFVYLICSKNVTEKKLSLEDDKNFLDIINHLTDLINGTKEFKNKIMLKKAKYNYEYPILKSHLAKKIQEDEKIRINQVKLLDRIEKVRYIFGTRRRTMTVARQPRVFTVSQESSGSSNSAWLHRSCWLMA